MAFKGNQGCTDVPIDTPSTIPYMGQSLSAGPGPSGGIPAMLSIDVPCPCSTSSCCGAGGGGGPAGPAGPPGFGGPGGGFLSL